MKVTICFDDVKIIVPCGNQTNEEDKINNNNLKVGDVIENAILRYKKATGKSNTCVIKVLNLQTIRDGGILDPDDYIRDVVEDKELLSAIYEEYQNGVAVSTKKPTSNQQNTDSNIMPIQVNCSKQNSLENTCFGNGHLAGNLKNFKAPFASQIANQMDNYGYIQKNQVLVSKTDVNKPSKPSNLRVKSGSESCIYNNILKPNAPNLSLITVNTPNLNQAPSKNMPDTDTNYFSRVNTNRQSIVKNDNGLWANSVHSDDYADIFTITLNNENSPAQTPRPLGIHVIPSHDSNTQKDSGLIIQRIEPNGRVHKDGRLQIGDRIIEINRQNLVDTDFIECQEMLREAIVASNADSRVLELKVARLKPNEQTPDDKENTDEIKNFNTTSTNLNVMNTKKLGKKVTVQLVKGPQGLGFKLAARDNCTPGEYSPIYIKNILPKGAAVTDGRLQRGDRLLEVNQIDMTQKTLHEAVNILRNTKLGDCVEIVVSRQVMPVANYGLPRELNEPNSDEIKCDDKTLPKRELLTFEIALNDTGSAGLGVSVKGKTKRLEDSENSVDLGIFVKTVINGGAASKDGRLRANDQLININGFSLLGKSNEEAMLILREAMQVESRPGHIELTVSRKLKPEIKPDEREESRQFVKIISHNNRKMDELEEERAPRFNRDAPNRRSMSEKRLKLGPVPANFQTRRNQSIDPKRSQTIQGISSIANNNFHQDSMDSEESKIPKQNLIVQDQMDENTPYYTEVKTRKSTSMESLPQNGTETRPKQPKVVNIHNKFGTVSGASVQNRPSVLPKESAKDSDVGVNRFRAVNRSFRTAVDKSLDVPAQSNEIPITFDEPKKCENRKLVDTIKSKDTKSLIGKFQNLFKSNSAKKNSTEDVSHSSSGKPGVELVNFHKIDSNQKLVQSVKSSPNQNINKLPNDTRF